MRIEEEEKEKILEKFKEDNVEYFDIKSKDLTFTWYTNVYGFFYSSERYNIYVRNDNWKDSILLEVFTDGLKIKNIDVGYYYKNTEKVRIPKKVLKDIKRAYKAIDWNVIKRMSGIEDSRKKSIQNTKDFFGGYLNEKNFN